MALFKLSFSSFGLRAQHFCASVAQDLWGHCAPVLKKLHARTKILQRKFKSLSNPLHIAITLCKLIKGWREEEDAVAATEAALIFPILLTMLLSMFDAGNAIIASQKAIKSSQIVADLLARTNVVDDQEFQDAVDAGALSFEPLSSDGYGYDIVSVRFDEDSNTEIVWRETNGMAASDDVLVQVSPLASPGGGVLVVTTQYEWEPAFAGFVMGAMTMEEVAFARGRNTAVIERE